MASNNKEAIALAITVLIFGGTAGVGAWFFNQNKTPNAITTVSTSSSDSNFNWESRQSEGTRLLITAESSADKEAAIASMAKQDYGNAVTQWQSALSKQRSDPESLIYLNNAKIGDRPSLKIAVVVPIGGNLNVAKEILRGVAQAQMEINNQGGINGLPLKILIANDDNKVDIATRIAQSLVADPKILAVVGHNSSDVSIAVAPTYQAGKLVMLSPTSTARELSGIGSYIFRTVPNVRFQADVLSKYVVKQQGKKNIGICANSSSKASQSLKEDFVAAVFADGAKISSVECDLAKPDFNADRAIDAMIGDRVDALLLSPGVEKIEKGLEIAAIVRNRLLLLTDSTLYTFKTLQLGQGAVENMVLTVPWHPDYFANNSFAGNAVKLWGGDVNWRSATSYDATMAIAGGLRQANSREGLQQSLASNSLGAEGASGKISFQPSGDRVSAAILVKVERGNHSGVGYDFVPLR